MLLYQLLPGCHFRFRIYFVVLFLVVLLTDPLDVGSFSINNGPVMDGDHSALKAELVASEAKSAGLRCRCSHDCDELMECVESAYIPWRGLEERMGEVVIVEGYDLSWEKGSFARGEF